MNHLKSKSRPGSKSKKKEFRHYRKFKADNEFELNKKRILVGVLFSAFFLLIFVLFWLPEAAEPWANRKIESWIHRSKGRNFEVRSFEYGDFHLTSGGLVFHQIQMRGLIRYSYPYFQPRQFEMNIPILQVYLRYGLRSGLRLGARIHGLEVKGGQVLPNVEESPRRLETISELNFQTWIPIGKLPWKWKRQMVNWARQFKNWVFNGAYMADIYMSGNATFGTDGVATRVYFSTHKERNASTHLEGNTDDLRLVARAIEPKFTEEDVRIASKNFLKTPKLLYVRTLAETKAEALYKTGGEISYDTFRHIFWSYYLAQTFGADFALRVTDAHEAEGSGNTALESEKDRRNNALGIEYAQHRFSESEVEKMIFNDPRVFQNQQAGF